MKQTKFKITLFALAAAFIFSVAALFAINFTPAKAKGTISISGSNVFTASNEANVVVFESDEKEEGSSDKNKCYTMFTFGSDEDNVSYRKNLAYNWWYQEKAEKAEGEEDDKAEYSNPINGRFNMVVGFPNTDFSKLVITFESQQYAKTEDGKTVNYIMFFPESDSGVKVLVTDDKDATK
ncbi:MAG: hypothetical protein K2N23_02765, partial [Clostridia bacterium]|nr:hypothetical protein [Clostridia bacterium]